MENEKRKVGRPKTLGEARVRYVFLMPPTLKTNYTKFCEEQAMTMNKRVNLLISKDMEGKLIITK
jgi:hypothetical protein